MSFETMKEEVKHSSSSLSELITCFISCSIMVVNCIYIPTIAAIAESAPAKAIAVATVREVSDTATSVITVRGGGHVGRSDVEGVGTSRSALKWDHIVDLNEDFRIFWTINNQDITFEIQVRALGYIGFGFSPDGNLAGSDIAIGWVDKGQTYFQDRHIQINGNPEPSVDPSQDYILMLGYENTTHTVLRFRRKLDTCDAADDIPITNNTMRLIFMYQNRDPPHGSLQSGTLPDPKSSFRPCQPMVLTQKSLSKFRLDGQTRQVELRNEDVELPSGDSTLYWCKMFKLEEFNPKHHLIRYEPIYDSSSSIHYLQQLTLYECQGSQQGLEQMSREQGRQCTGNSDLSLACNAITAAWFRGSEGFTYPLEAGYPLESQVAKYYLMETHYNNIQPDDLLENPQMVDNSGLRIFYTPLLRPNDAGILSIGLEQSWRHIIPPGQTEVVSEGQCIEDCTSYAFPSQGIQIFAVMLRTHQIGKEVKLRQIRQTVELPPIAMDANVDPAYQDFRYLSTPVRSKPGDRLIAECIYDSSSRNSITLGGLTMKEESCTVLTVYYPRQKELTTCHSLPSLPTVLSSLGITELATDSNPVLISAPSELAGMTLEDRLISYDWQNQFDKFQEATRRGTFRPLCWGANNHVIPASENLEGYSLSMTKTYKKHLHCKPKQRTFSPEGSRQVDIELPVLHEVGNNIIEGAARSSRSSTISEKQGSSTAQRYDKSRTTAFWYASAFIILQQKNRWMLP